MTFNFDFSYNLDSSYPFQPQIPKMQNYQPPYPDDKPPRGQSRSHIPPPPAGPPTTQTYPAQSLPVPIPHHPARPGHDASAAPPQHPASYQGLHQPGGAYQPAVQPQFSRSLPGNYAAPPQPYQQYVAPPQQQWVPPPPPAGPPPQLHGQPAYPQPAYAPQIPALYQQQAPAFNPVSYGGAPPAAAAAAAAAAAEPARRRSSASHRRSSTPHRRGSTSRHRRSTSRTASSESSLSSSEGEEVLEAARKLPKASREVDRHPSLGDTLVLIVDTVKSAFESRRP
jgi:hypothetical protein